MKIIQSGKEKQPTEDEDGDGGDGAEDQVRGYPGEKGVLLIFPGLEANRVQKIRSREVNDVVHVTPKYLNWSEMLITFDQSDHSAHVPFPGRQALVVDTFVNGFRLQNVLMDGGAGLNILFASTLEKMGIPLSRLNPTGMMFHGVVLGIKAKPLG